MGSQGLPLGVRGPDLRVGVVGPQQGVAVTQVVTAGRIGRGVQTFGVQGLHLVRARARAALDDTHKGAVDHVEMIAVYAVFHLEFPVAVIGVIRATGDHLPAIRGLVGQHVNDRQGRGQVVFEGGYGGVERAEQKAFVIGQPGDGREAVRLFLERGRIGTVGVILDADQRAGSIERPAVIRTGQHPLVAAFEWAYGGSSVRTGVDERADLTGLVAHQEDRLAAHADRKEIVGSGKLALMRQVDPTALEDMLHLQIEDARIPEYVPVHRKHALLGAVYDVVAHVPLKVSDRLPVVQTGAGCN